jgi:2'-5' RNA ligase
MRLFVGIALADAVMLELKTVLAQLNSKAAPAGSMRWTGPDSWHITLQFLGNATSEQVQCLNARLSEVRSEPVLVELGELGSFDRTGVFFADVIVSPGLAALQQRVVAATSRCGFAAEARPFHPHITLARTTGNKGTREQGSREQGSRGPRSGSRTLRDWIAVAGACRFSSFAAHEFLLYESHLNPAGARYEVKARFPLADRGV